MWFKKLWCSPKSYIYWSSFRNTNFPSRKTNEKPIESKPIKDGTGMEACLDNKIFQGKIILTFPKNFLYSRTKILFVCAHQYRSRAGILLWPICSSRSICSSPCQGYIFFLGWLWPMKFRRVNLSSEPITTNSAGGGTNDMTGQRLGLI